MNHLHKIKSPFKFLDSFERKDSNVFFGRDKEIAALYESVNKNRLVMVYGSSGTGKTSLIQCGLASRFDATDWYPIFVRRGENINDSLQEALQKVAGERYQADDLVGTLQQLDYRFLRPIYLVFDQLEELLILGDLEEEQIPFIENVAKILNAGELSCRVLFVLREEYLAQLYHFEAVIPTLFDRRLRIEQMRYSKVADVLEKSFDEFNIKLENKEKNIQQIIESISAEKSGIQLPYLQVYLDRLYREDHARHYSEGTNIELPPLEFTTADIEKFGRIENVLAKFLQEQTRQLQEAFENKFPEADSKTLIKIIDTFVTSEGTKRPLPFKLENELVQVGKGVKGFLQELPSEQLTFCLDELENRRLLRKTEHTYELAHDSLAALINKKRTDEERLLNREKSRIQNAYEDWERHKIYFTEHHLISIEEIRPKLDVILPVHLLEFLEKSEEKVNYLKAQKEYERDEKLRLTEAKLEAEQKTKLEQEKIIYLTEAKLAVERRGRRLQRVFLGLLLALLAIVFMFLLQAQEEQKQADKRTQAASAHELSDEAEIQLLKGNRTTAYRIAEMAYRYITPDDIDPDDNAKEVLQDAYYYNSSLDKTKNDSLYKFWDRNLIGHDDMLFSIACSPNNQFVLTGSNDSTAIIWDFATGEEIRVLQGHKGRISTVNFSSDNRLAITGSKDSTAIVWEVETGEINNTFNNNAPIHLAQFSSDGKLVLTASEDSKIKIWELKTGDLIDTYPYDISEAKGVAFSADGNLLLTGAEEKVVNIFDTKTNRIIRRLKGHDKPIYTIAVSANDSLIASNDSTIIIWNLKTGKKIHTLEGDNSNIVSLKFSPDNKLLAAGSRDKTAKIWNVDTGEKIRVLDGHDENIEAVNFSADSKYLLTASKDKTVKIWDIYALLETCQLEGHTEKIKAVAFSENGKLVMTGSWDKTAKVWDAETGKEIFNLKHRSGVNAVAFSPNNNFMATSSRDRTAIIWDTKTGEKLHILQGHTSSVEAIAFSPNNKFIATGSRDKTAKIWNVETGEKLRDIQGHQAFISSVDFSSDGKLILTSSEDRTTKIWNEETGKQIKCLKKHTTYIYDATFSKDSEHILTGSCDKTIKIWEVETGKEVRTLPFHYCVNAVAFSPDGNKILAGGSGNKAMIWNLDIESILKQREGELSALNPEQIQEYNLLSLLGSTDGAWKKMLEKENQNQLKAFAMACTEKAKNSTTSKNFNPYYKKAEECYDAAIKKSKYPAPVLKDKAEMMVEWARRLLDIENTEAAIEQAQKAIATYKKLREQTRLYDKSIVENLELLITLELPREVASDFLEEL